MLQGIHEDKGENVQSFLESLHTDKHQGTWIQGVDGTNEIKSALTGRKEGSEVREEEGMKYGN